ncbi:hypothetical protein [Sphingomonas sp. MMS24-J13]|uniref:hypothetical protein n=1 Tax=Sphingomonas sp. MMS24-J13 TaxID=3238686 RepID=UPI00385000A6
MPVRKLREDHAPRTAQPATRLTGNIDGVAAMPSPARSLQQQLEMHAGSQMLPHGEKWSPRRALAFIVAASAALWMALIVAGAEVIRLIA